MINEIGATILLVGILGTLIGEGIIIIYLMSGGITVKGDMYTVGCSCDRGIELKEAHDE